MRLRTSICLVLTACGPEVAVDDAGADGTTDTGGPGTMTVSATDPSATAPSTADESDVDDDDDGPIFDDGFAGDLPPPSRCSADEPCKLDVLVVVDNSSGMADAQVSLTRGLVELVGRIEASADVLDVQMMFTTTDMGNPVCTPFQKPDYTPAMGSPIATGCLDRLNRFTGLGNDPAVREEVCQDMCTPNLAPSDPFIAFVGATESNVPEGLVEDIDNDGDFDSRVAQTVACVAPQGIDGCGFEQPLESMLQALNPEAEWNNGERPFLRSDSTLLVVLATDEMDCSMNDFSPMYDEQWWETNPTTMQPQPSSAICWNAGTQCSGPNADGIYTECPTTNEPMLSPDRYTDYLVHELRENQGREVTMIAFTGVPHVDARNPDPPFQPTAGGLIDLVYRWWEYEDLLPPDLENGVTVEDKYFGYLAGPGCTDYDASSGRTVQAIPNPRATGVCESLDIGGELRDDGVRCCVESICDPTLSFDCVDGWLASGHVIEVPGG